MNSDVSGITSGLSSRSGFHKSARRGNGRRRQAEAAVAAAALAAAFGGRVALANTPDYFQGTSTNGTPAALDDPTNYSLGTVPTVANDAVINSTRYNVASATLTLGTSQAFGSLDVTNTLGVNTPYAITVQGTATTATTLTLGGGSNSVAPSTADLLYVDAGSTLTITNSSTGTVVPGLAIGAVGNFDVAGTATISSIISGSNALTKTGAGTMTLVGHTTSGTADTYTGGTFINGGILEIQNTYALGPSLGANISAGALRDTLSVTTGRAFGIQSSTSTIDVSSGQLFLLTSATGLQGSGVLNVNASGNTNDIGTLETYGTNVGLTGGTINVVQGLFELGYNTSLGIAYEGTSSTVINLGTPTTGATLLFGNFLSGSNTNPITIANSGSTIYDGSGFNWNVSGGLSGSGTLNKTGVGQINLTASNSYTGGTNITAGTLDLIPQSATSTPAGTGAITVGAAILDLAPTSSAYNTANAVVLASPTSAIYVPSGFTSVETGVISNTSGGVLNKIGAGTLELTAASTYTGGLNVSAGTFEFTTTSAIPVGNTITLASGTTLLYANATNNVSLNRALVLSGTGFSSLNVSSSSVTDLYAGTITGTGGLTKVGGYTLYLTNSANTYSGGTNISTGTLRSNAVGATGTGLVNVVAGATLGGSGSTGATTVAGTITAGASGTAIGTLTTGLLTLNTATILTKIDGNVAVASAGGIGDSGVAGTANDLLLTTGGPNASSGTTTVTPSILNTPLTVGSNYSLVIADTPAANISAGAATFAALVPNLAISNSFYYANATFADATNAGDGDDELVLNFTAAPEPTSLLLLGVVAAPLGLSRRRRQASLA